MDRQMPPQPDRIRRMSGGFGWVDHRIRWFMEDMRQEEILLYFFLVITANEQGCSWWPTRKVTKLLKIGPASLQRAREELEKRGMIAIRKDELSNRIVYQLLDLPIIENERIEIPVKKAVATEKPSKKKISAEVSVADQMKNEPVSLSEEQQNLNLANLNRIRSLLAGIEGEK